MEELKTRIREELAEARKKAIHSDRWGEIYHDGKASAFVETVEIIEDIEEAEKMKKKESLLDVITAVHEKAKQMKEELKDVGLDDMVEEQERIVIASLISNEFWRLLVK